MVEIENREDSLMSAVVVFVILSVIAAMMMLCAGCNTPAQRVETAKEALIVATDQAYVLIDTGIVDDEDTARLILTMAEHGALLVAEAEAAVELGQDAWKPLLLRVAEITRRMLAIKIHEDSQRRIE
jgi:hypothetical protein